MATQSLLDAGYRRLTDFEVQTLEANGCTATDWDAVQVAAEFDLNTVREAHFSGQVRLGSFRESIRLAGGFERPTGIYDATLHNCTVGNNVLIRNVQQHIANYHIADRVVIENLGLLATEGETSFGQGTMVCVVNESGGREIPIFDRLSSQLAWLLAFYQHAPQLQQALRKMVSDYVAEKTSGMGVIQAGAELRDCGRLLNVWVGPQARVVGAEQLSEGTLASTAAAPIFVGPGVVARNFIIASGSQVDEGSTLAHCFVGQAVRVARQFAGEHSVFFANSEFLGGEACNLLAGPYSVSHHKSTLLIASACSFFNAGSGTNQSNHMYKLGPVHQGLLERGSKTGSGSSLMWPARVGPFTAVLGQHRHKFDTAHLPFSYLMGSDGRSTLIPAANLFNVGVFRDSRKWPAREQRTDPHRLDLLHYETFSPFTVGRMIAGTKILEELEQRSSSEQTQVASGGIVLPRARLHKAQLGYQLAIRMYLGSQIAQRLETCRHAQQPAEVMSIFANLPSQGTGPWLDLGGLLTSQARLDELLDHVAAGRISTLTDLESHFQQVHDTYAQLAWAWTVDAWLGQIGKNVSAIQAADLHDAVDDWQQGTLQYHRGVLRDAAAEFHSPARLTYGVAEVPGAAEADFAAVRGSFDQHELVVSVDEASQQVSHQAAQLSAWIDAHANEINAGSRPGV